MGEFSTLLQQGNAWFFIPSAILLGVLHGLEPGHSKTMMAAFIIAIKGTIKQAVMLGLAATLSHTAVVWLIALGGMYISKAFTAQAVEPWLQFVSAIIILGTAFWMFWRTWQGEQNWLARRITTTITGITTTMIMTTIIMTTMTIITIIITNTSIITTMAHWPDSPKAQKNIRMPTNGRMPPIFSAALRAKRSPTAKYYCSV